MTFYTSLQGWITDRTRSGLSQAVSLDFEMLHCNSLLCTYCWIECWKSEGGITSPKCRLYVFVQKYFNGKYFHWSRLVWVWPVRCQENLLRIFIFTDHERVQTYPRPPSHHGTFDRVYQWSKGVQKAGWGGGGYEEKIIPFFLYHLKSRTESETECTWDSPHYFV